MTDALILSPCGTSGKAHSLHWFVALVTLNNRNRSIEAENGCSESREL